MHRSSEKRVQKKAVQFFNLILKNVIKRAFIRAISLYFFHTARSTIAVIIK